MLPLLLACLGSCARTDQSNMYLALQSYSVDQIGRASHTCRVAFFGEPFDLLEFERTHILFHNQNPFHFTSPYWFHFIGNNYHYLPLKTATFEFSRHVEISPPNLNVRNIEVLVMRRYLVNITNAMDKNMSITEVRSFSREVYVEEMSKTKVLKPGDTFTLPVYICALGSGTFSNVLLISTSLGVIPYSIAITALRERGDALPVGLWHQCAMLASNMTFYVPKAMRTFDLSVLYDAGLLEIYEEGNDSAWLTFTGAGMIESGFHVSFIHLMSSTICRNIPVFMLSTVKFLQPIDPVLIVPTVTHENSRGEAKITIVNPTLLNLSILSVHFAPGTPSNMVIQHTKPPTIVKALSSTSLGTVVVHPTRNGEVEGNIVVTYDSAGVVTQTVEIPVKGLVCIGRFVPCAPKIELIRTISEVYHFHFMNFFKEPMVVLAVRTETEQFKFPDFEAFIVPPGARSKDIDIWYVMNQVHDKTDDLVIIETNITRFAVPICAYSGRMSIGTAKEPSMRQNNQLTFNLGKVPVSSSRVLTFYIKNQNPIPFRTKPEHCNCTSGITVDRGVFNFAVDKFSTHCVNLSITLNTQKPGSTNDTIYIAFDKSSTLFEITVTWEPEFGDVRTSSSLPSRIMYGLQYEAELYVESTYEKPLLLKYVSTNTGFFKEVDVAIMSNVSRRVCNLTLSVDQHFLKRFDAIDFNPSDSGGWSAQAQAWSFWKAPVVVPIRISLELESGMILTSTFEVEFVHGTFSDSTYDFGTVVVNATQIGFTSVYNTFDLPVIFYVADTSESKGVFSLMSPVSAVVRPNEPFNISFRYSPTKLGQTILQIPITTNSTPPFFVELAATVVPPVFDFIDEQGSSLTSLNFADVGSSSLYRTLYVKNNGHATIPFTTIWTDADDIVSWKSNCSAVLLVDEACRIDMRVTVGKFINQNRTFSVLVGSCGTERALTVNIAMDKLSFKVICMKRWAKFIFLIVTSAAPVIWTAVSSFIQARRTAEDYYDRLSALDSEIDRLTVSKRSSIGIQSMKTAKQNKTGGKWVRSVTPHTTYVSQTNLNFMHHMLTQLQ